MNELSEAIKEALLKAYNRGVEAGMGRRSECPFCGSDRLIIGHENDSTIMPRKGCLSCGEWLQPVRLKDRR
jgi:uncharacterized protein (DUF983 family)